MVYSDDVMKHVNYEVLETPTDYKCSVCGATECKLWREYNTFNPALFCAPCAAKKQKKGIKSINAEGMRHGRICGYSYIWTDQIGSYVPAVPDEEGLGYWGYTSVPETGCEWWKKLSTLPSLTN